jgi:hypothetical protein
VCVCVCVCVLIWLCGEQHKEAGHVYLGGRFCRFVEGCFTRFRFRV